MFRIGSRVSLAAALATALLTGPVAPTASAASVPAKSATAEGRCSAFATFTLYTYYSSGTYTTIVGQGELTCEGDFVMHSGVQTQWFKTKTMNCVE